MTSIEFMSRAETKSLFEDLLSRQMDFVIKEMDKLRIKIIDLERVFDDLEEKKK